ncbi:MAG: hypothetical protein WBX25_20665 [Rhodomicrobium sp.]
MSSKGFIVIVLFALLPTDFAYAQGAFEFVSEYVRELGEIESLRSTTLQELQAEPKNTLPTCIRGNTRMQLALGSHAKFMKRAIAEHKITNPDIIKIIKIIGEMYEHKIEVLQRMSDNCTAFINGPKPNVDYGKLAAEAPIITAHLESVDQALFEVTPAIFASLIDERPDAENHMSHLTITKAERADLVRSLNIYFGKKIDSKDHNYTVSTASVLRFYLTKKGYKCSDEPW